MALSGYVYILTETTTGKKYVGRTTNPKARKSSHMIALRGGYHNNKEMQADFNKYHGDYRFEVIGYDDHHKSTGTRYVAEMAIRAKTASGSTNQEVTSIRWMERLKR